jgi:hypothetical protein
MPQRCALKITKALSKGAFLPFMYAGDNTHNVGNSVGLHKKYI